LGNLLSGNEDSGQAGKLRGLQHTQANSLVTSPDEGMPLTAADWKELRAANAARVIV